MSESLFDMILIPVTVNTVAYALACTVNGVAWYQSNQSHSLAHSLTHAIKSVDLKGLEWKEGRRQAKKAFPSLLHACLLPCFLGPYFLLLVVVGRCGRFGFLGSGLFRLINHPSP